MPKDVQVFLCILMLHRIYLEIKNLYLYSSNTTSGNMAIGLALPSRFPYEPGPMGALVPVLVPRAPARSSPGS